MRVKKKQRKNLLKHPVKKGKRVGRHKGFEEAARNPSVGVKVPHKSEKKVQRDKAKNEKYVRKLQLLEANADENKTIKKLEKALKLKKRKRTRKKNDKVASSEQKISSMFVEDGLDYILDVIDKPDNLCINSDLSDSETDIRKERSLQHQNKRKANEITDDDTNVKKPRRLVDLLREQGEVLSDEEGEGLSDDEERNESIDDENDKESDDSLSSDDESVLENEDAESLTKAPKSLDTKDKKKKPKIWEDIYGRLRDEDGNVIENEVKSGLYVPPAKRCEPKTVDAKKKQELQRITSQLKGLINRLTEANLQTVSSQIKDMYMKHSRNDMSETLMSLVVGIINTETFASSRIIMDLAMLIAVLYNNVGSEVGAYFLQFMAVKFDQLIKVGGDTKETNGGEWRLCKNLLIFLSHLHNFEVTNCLLIFDVLECLIESFQDKDIELIQLILKYAGFSLRKSNPKKLKETFQVIKNKAASFQASEDNSRIQFMLETLRAVGDNCILKFPKITDYDPTTVQRARTIICRLVNLGAKDLKGLTVSLKELLEAEENGRRWTDTTPGSLRENFTESESNTFLQSCSVLSETDVSILELARQQHMNTDIRKTIFCIIMTAEDCMDAFEKLMRLNLKIQQQREIANIILHCALREKPYNPYYAVLAGKFCQFDRKHRTYKANLQFALRNKFDEMGSLGKFQVNNMAYFLVDLITRSELPISVLKTIHFADMNKTMVSFFRKILLGILLHDSEEVCSEVFRRIAPVEGLSLLREGLRLFMHHFLLQNSEANTSEKLLQRIKVAENALNSAKRRVF